MEKIITGVEFAILVAIVVGIAILLHIMEARRIMAKDDNPAQDADRQHEDESPTRSFREALAHYNDTEHEHSCANMEPFGGAGDAHATTMEQERRAKAEADRQAYSRQAIRRAQEAARNSTVRHFAEDLSKRDDELKAREREIRRTVLAEQRIILDKMTGHKQ